MDETRTDTHPPHEPSQGHEPISLSVPFVLYSAVGLVILIITALILMQVGLSWLLASPAPPTPPQLRPTQTDTQPPGPRIEADLSEQLRRLRAENDAVLASYDWVDREQQTVRIPIQRAIDLLAERGLSAATQPSDGSDQDAPSKDESTPDSDAKPTTQSKPSSESQPIPESEPNVDRQPSTEKPSDSATDF
jgi:hypothetical protein